jgi:SAM-dependent methyltransferase
MFDNYKDIFNARGAAYHQGMLEQPRAREQEFAAMLRLAEPRDGQVICDMPSGGGYLRNFIDADVTLLCVETSQAFADRVKQTDKMRAILADLHSVPIDAKSVDTVISLAGLHHVADRPAMFAGIRRMLKPGGRACFADVTAGSPVDSFLNGFVHRHNSMGHQGEFVCDKIRDELSAAGFTINSDRQEHFHWLFETEPAMARFCRLLFGLDKADEAQTLQGLRDTVGYDRDGERWRMNWELTCLRAVPT